MVTLETPDLPSERIDLVVVEPNGLKIHYSLGAEWQDSSIDRSTCLPAEVHITSPGLILFKIFERLASCKLIVHSNQNSFSW
jgi:hypothetical protein